MVQANRGFAAAVAVGHRRIPPKDLTVQDVRVALKKMAATHATRTLQMERQPVLRPHYGWRTVHCGAVLAGRMTQRKPRWLVEVSMDWGIRAAGR